MSGPPPYYTNNAQQPAFAQANYYGGEPNDNIPTAQIVNENNNGYNQSHQQYQQPIQQAYHVQPPPQTMRQYVGGTNVQNNPNNVYQGYNYNNSNTKDPIPYQQNPNFDDGGM